MKLKIILLFLIISTYSLAQSEETSSGLSVLLPAGIDSEAIFNYGLAFEMRPLFDLNDELYIGGVVGVDLYNVSQESLEGESLVFIPVQATVRYYILEFVYVNLDAGYGFNVDQLGLQSGIKAQIAVGYSFDGFNIQAGYHLQQQENFNLTSYSLGVYLTF